MNMKALPPLETILAHLAYDPETGLLTRKPAPRLTRALVGSSAGFKAPHGYICVRVGGSVYLAQRIIFKVMTGRDPMVVMDHIDGDRSNNRWSNLREADWTQNSINSKLFTTNKLGIRGVIKLANGKYRASYIVRGKRRYAQFNILDEARLTCLVNARLNYGEYASKRTMRIPA